MTTQRVTLAYVLATLVAGVFVWTTIGHAASQVRPRYVGRPTTS